MELRAGWFDWICSTAAFPITIHMWVLDRAHGKNVNCLSEAFFILFRGPLVFVVFAQCCLLHLIHVLATCRNTWRRRGGVHAQWAIELRKSWKAVTSKEATWLRISHCTQSEREMDVFTFKIKAWISCLPNEAAWMRYFGLFKSEFLIHAACHIYLLMFIHLQMPTIHNMWVRWYCPEP